MISFYAVILAGQQPEIYMFTGLVEKTATIKNIRPEGGHSILSITSPFDINDLEMGESIAINGACLTVCQFSSDTISFTAQKETLDKTYLGDLKPGDIVNVERALTLGTRLGGHLMQGHVDEVGYIESNEQTQTDWVLAIRASESFMDMLIQKGSVAIDGISLTVVEKKKSVFTVHIIPHTLYNTTLHNKKRNAPVNLEADMIGKYVRNYIQQIGGSNSDQSLMQKLQEGGFI